MPDRTLSARADETIVEIDSLIRQTHDEHASSRTVAVLHDHAMMNLRFDVRDVYRPDAEAEAERVAWRDAYIKRVPRLHVPEAAKTNATGSLER